MRNNQIHKLKNEKGQWVESENDLTKLMPNYFNDLLKVTEANWQEVVSCIPMTIINF